MARLSHEVVIREPENLRTIGTGLLFPEGPLALPDGSVLVVEIARGTLSRVYPSGTVEIVADCGGGPNGAAFGPDGEVWIANNGGCFEWRVSNGLRHPVDVPAGWRGGALQRVDLASGAVDTVYTEVDGRRLRAPNDLVVDAAGGLWMTDHGVRRGRTSDRTGVLHARLDGSAITEVAFPLDQPNGIALSPSGGTLYVAETATARCWSWPVEGPGRLGRTPGFEHGGRLLVGLPGLQFLDSMAVDGEGWVCLATIGSGGITAVSPDGSCVEYYPLPDRMVTNLCFGGPDGRTAFVTLSGSGALAAFDWPRPGLATAFAPSIAPAAQRGGIAHLPPDPKGFP